jgi:two-component system response regulator AtoC
MNMPSFGIGAQLVWESGDRPPFPLNKVITTLGRNEANDVMLDDPKVSSFHGNILNREDGWHLLDLKSRNGTLVNGKPVTACALRDGDAIAFGDITLRFQSPDPFRQGPLPLARLNQKIHTMAIQSPALRREAEEILREVERHEAFLKGLVETVSALAESRTQAHFAGRLAEILTRRLECRAVQLAAGSPRDLPARPPLETAAWDAGWSVDAVPEGRRLRLEQRGTEWRAVLAFAAAPGRGSIAFLAEGLPSEPREETRDLLEMILLFASVLWRNLGEIEELHRQETGRLLEEKERESRKAIDSLESRNRELDGFLQRMRSQLVFAEGGPMEKIQALARKLATVDLPVLITGETGTGKTYIANLIHHYSARAGKPFTVIDCATLPANLIESELFGHEKGAFTGAVARKIGKVEACAGGTLFLDEIGDLPLELQGKLLRFVQEGRFERLGGNETVQVDVRIVAATNHDLQERVKAQKFRQDLFYRLHVLPLAMPALRERADDIPVLARHFIRKHFGQDSWSFTPDALEAIKTHPWPGNVRELENKLQRAWLFHAGDRITAADLGLEAAGPSPRAAAGDEPLDKKTLEEYREEYESALLRRCLKHYKGNITKCAEHLQISRNTCKSMLRKYRLVGDQDDDAGEGNEG